MTQNPIEMTDNELKQYIDQVFIKYDRERDGTLKTLEMANYLTELFQILGYQNVTITPQQAQQAIKMIDKNNDNKISKMQLFLTFKQLANTKVSEFGDVKIFFMGQGGFDSDHPPADNQNSWSNPAGWGTTQGSNPWNNTNGTTGINTNANTNNNANVNMNTNGNTNSWGTSPSSNNTNTWGSNNNTNNGWGTPNNTNSSNNGNNGNIWGNANSNNSWDTNNNTNGWNTNNNQIPSYTNNSNNNNSWGNQQPNWANNQNQPNQNTWGQQEYKPPRQFGNTSTNLQVTPPPGTQNTTQPNNVQPNSPQYNTPQYNTPQYNTPQYNTPQLPPNPNFKGTPQVWGPQPQSQPQQMNWNQQARGSGAGSQQGSYQQQARGSGAGYGYGYGQYAGGQGFVNSGWGSNNQTQGWGGQMRPGTPPSAGYMNNIGYAPSYYDPYGGYRVGGGNKQQ